jgi:hypothetical protein
VNVSSPKPRSKHVETRRAPLQAKAAALPGVARIVLALLLCAVAPAVCSPCPAAAADARKHSDDNLRACKREPVPPEKESQKFKGCLSSTVYVAGGGGEGLVVTGTVADPTRPFTLRGTFPGGASVHTYTPTSAAGGTSAYTLSGSGVTGAGRGTYTISRRGGNWMLVDTTTGCVTGIPGSCRTNVANITLTARTI